MKQLNILSLIQRRSAENRRRNRPPAPKDSSYMVIFKLETRNRLYLVLIENKIVIHAKHRSLPLTHVTYWMICVENVYVRYVRTNFTHTKKMLRNFIKHGCHYRNIDWASISTMPLVFYDIVHYKIKTMDEADGTISKYAELQKYGYVNTNLFAYQVLYNVCVLFMT